MFRRKWSALPEEAQFESDFKSLGYFINKDDEIRSLEDEDDYYKYFLNRNPRINERQRFALNRAVQAELRQRLTNLGLVRLTLPLGAEPSSSPNLPIFVTPNIKKKSRVVLIFGETHQDFGVLAHRVINGPGGVDKGSIVSIVKALLQRSCSPADPSPPGIILANMGELIWWPEGRQTLTRITFDWLPMRSAAHIGNYIDPEVNSVRENENALAHVKYIFEKVVPSHVGPDAGLDVIGLGDGADVVEEYLNCDETWKRVGGRINCFASVGGQFPEWDVKCDGLREFMKDRARAYVPSTEPLGLVLAGPEGNPNTTTFTSLGCPVFSAGHPSHVEMLFISSHEIVLTWLDEVAATPPDEKPYMNPTLTVLFSEPSPESNTWADEGGVVAEKSAAEDSELPKFVEISKHEGTRVDEDGYWGDNRAKSAKGQMKTVTGDDMGSDHVDGGKGGFVPKMETEPGKERQTLVLRPKKTESTDKDQGDNTEP